MVKKITAETVFFADCEITTFGNPVWRRPKLASSIRTVKSLILDWVVRHSGDSIRPSQYNKIRHAGTKKLLAVHPDGGSYGNWVIPDEAPFLAEVTNDVFNW